MLVDITLPLCRGRVISFPNGSKSWVNFKYERLPNMCYWCGRLDHNDRDCELWIESKGTLTTEQQQFGSGLRAPSYKTAGFLKAELGMHKAKRWWRNQMKQSQRRKWNGQVEQ